MSQTTCLTSGQERGATGRCAIGNICMSVFGAGQGSQISDLRSQRSASTSIQRRFNAVLVKLSVASVECYPVYPVDLVLYETH